MLRAAVEECLCPVTALLRMRLRLPNMLVAREGVGPIVLCPTPTPTSFYHSTKLP